MLELEISVEAENDLLEPWLYIAEDQPTNADRYLDKLQEKAQKLAAFRELGRDRPELAPGLKSFPVDRYNLYYTVTETKLILVRVFREIATLPQSSETVSACAGHPLSRVEKKA